MKKINQIQEKLRGITVDDFAEFLREKNAFPLSCPICHSNNIVVKLYDDITISTDPNRSSSGTYMLPSLNNPLSEDNLSNYHYGAICQNCSYQMTFNAYFLIEWFEKKGNKNG